MDHQAFAQLLGNYGEFIGAIAVVLTLVYLAAQVKHGKAALDANTQAMEREYEVKAHEALKEISESGIDARQCRLVRNFLEKWAHIRLLYRPNFPYPCPLDIVGTGLRNLLSITWQLFLPYSEPISGVVALLFPLTATQKAIARVSPPVLLSGF